MRHSFLPALLFCLAIITPASAYELFMCGDAPCHWHQWPVPYYINERGTEDMENEFDVVQQSFSRWEQGRQTFCGIEFDYRGTTRISKSEMDGYNVVLWIENEDDWDYSPSALALTQCWFDDSGTFHDCDIMVNGVDYQWAESDNGEAFDLRGTMTHEIGHLWGLDHSGVRAATMYEFYNNRVNASDLDYDDILGGRDVFCPQFEMPEDDAYEQNDAYVSATRLDENEVAEPLLLYDDDWFAIEVPLGKRVKALIRDEDRQRPKVILLTDGSGEILDSANCFGDCNVALGEPVDSDIEAFFGKSNDRVKLALGVSGNYDDNPITTDQYAIKVEFVDPGDEGELFDDDDQVAEGEELCGCDQAGAFGGTTSTLPPAGPIAMVCLMFAVTLFLRARAAGR